MKKVRICLTKNKNKNKKNEKNRKLNFVLFFRNFVENESWNFRNKNPGDLPEQQH